MRWQGRTESSNIEDRRGQSGGGGGLGLPRGKFGIGATLVILVIGVATGTDVTQLLGLTSALDGASDATPSSKGPPTDDEARFIAVVLADTESTWSELFAANGKTYVKPKLVLFDDAVSSACGHTTSAVGPFYCPGDRKVYLDLTFFSELSRRLGAPGDFARAYVVGHEVGHHIQTLLGTSEQVHRQRSRVSETEANQLSVRQELQADCYAGVWGYHANQRQLLEAGDIEEALTAAAAIGDDRLQQQAGAAVRPESWTHGASAQRVHWFKTGLKSGKMSDCDTFAAAAL